MVQVRLSTSNRIMQVGRFVEPSFAQTEHGFYGSVTVDMDINDIATVTFDVGGGLKVVDLSSNNETFFSGCLLV